MSDVIVPGDDGEPVGTTPGQSGLQVWLVCALFILVPVVLILVVKFLFGV